MRVKTVIICLAATSILAPLPAMANHQHVQEILAACKTAIKPKNLKGSEYSAELGKCRGDPKSYNIDY